MVKGKVGVRVKSRRVPGGRLQGFWSGYGYDGTDPIVQLLVTGQGQGWGKG